MAKALTKISIDKATPRTGVDGKPIRTELPDGALPGLYFIIQPTGAQSWAVRYRIGGRPRKHTLGTYPRVTLADARAAARKALATVGEGVDPAVTARAARAALRPAAGDLFEVVARDFLERHAKRLTRESTWRETERLLNKDVIPAWKGRVIQSIGKRDIVELLDQVVDRGSGVMANRTLAHVRKLFAWCVDRDLLQLSPAAGVRPPADERSRDRVLSDAELAAVWTGASAIAWPFGPLVMLLILTGQRRDEVAGMRWSELDLERGLWVMPRERVKNDQAHEVPLSSQSIAVLASVPRFTGSDLVFTTTGFTAITGFSRAKHRLDDVIAQTRPDLPQMDGWVLHDLRRTFASGLARLGANLPVIERILNHRSGSFAGIVGVYQRHEFGPEKRSAMDSWGRHIEGIVSGGRGNVVELRVAAV